MAELSGLMQKLMFRDDYWKKIVDEYIIHAPSLTLVAASVKSVNQYSLEELKKLVGKIEIDPNYRQAYRQLFKQIEWRLADLGPVAAVYKVMVSGIISTLSGGSTVE
ncbi:MAG: hypothetical protein JXJ04_14940 [Spirochaetales bacterium]|nr:hypothetical protein [Spirochaetales bacterium]